MARAIASIVGKKARRKTIKVAQAGVPYEVGLDARLRNNPRYTLDYLNACLEDSDSGVFLLALKDVARAWGGMSRLSLATNLNRETLYHTLSKKGNPTLSSLESMLDALGFKLKIEAK